MIALLITGVLVISAGAQENSDPQTANSVMAQSPLTEPSSTATAPAQKQMTPGALDAEGYAQRTGGNGGGKIVVDVWSSAPSAAAEPKEADPAKLSPDFAATALSAASRIQFTQRRITNSIKMGFPLGGGFWIQADLDAIDDTLRMAALAVINDADRQALQEIENQTSRLRIWCDWLIEQNRELRLADYYLSPARLDNDERFQSTVTCNKFLISMLASGRLDEDRSCR